MKNALTTMEVLRTSGDAEVAEVAVARFRNDDRYTVEVVDGLTPPLNRREKWIINISTQFGCPVGCPFCDAAAEYAGNPSREELLEQVRWALARHPGEAQDCAKLKVHFARMGEPSLNPAVIEAMAELPSLIPSKNLWACVATVAPRGRETWFEALRELKDQKFSGRFQLQFSVQSTDEEHRNRLIPIPHWQLAQIARYGESFHRPGDRKVVLNFALATDVAFDPKGLGARFDPAHFAVKLTPVNPTTRGEENGFQTVLRSERDSRIKESVQVLTAHGFDVVLSVGDEREDSIGSNCGQAVRVARRTSGEPLIRSGLAVQAAMR